MAPTPNFPMPFATTPCSIWRAYYDEQDAYGNVAVRYNPDPDWTGPCVYTPGRSKTDTSNDIEQGRPYGAEVRITVYLPMTLDMDLRDAQFAVYPDDDSVLVGHKFTVVGNPISYPRSNTPGDYSWAVEGVDWIG